MKILVTGASGLLGGKIAEAAIDRGHEVLSSYKEHSALIGTPLHLDQTNEGQLKQTILRIQPQVIINTAALSDVDFCEENPDAAFLVNYESVSYLANVTREVGGFFLQVSTDYVFDGEKGSYSEADLPNPVNRYGLSKFQGEKAAISAGEGSWSVARSSVIFGWGRPHRPNAASYVYEKLSKHETISMVQDQYCSPTFNTNLAAMLVEVAERKIPGILHTAGATRLSRYELAIEVADALRLDRKLVQQAVVKDLTWRARRPRDSSLTVARAARLLSHKPDPIADALDQYGSEHRTL